MSSLPYDTAKVPAGFGFVQGSSAAMERLNRIIGEIARTSIPVLLLGESGTGKEVYARLIHRLSKLQDAPLNKLCCRVLGPSGLLEQLKPSQSSFVTSADRDRLTLFLDGIDELDLACQKVLLTLLPDGQMGVGGDNRVRIIASASGQLEGDVESGQ